MRMGLMALLEIRFNALAQWIMSMQVGYAAVCRSYGDQAAGGAIVSVRPRQVAVLCLEVAHTAYLNRMEKYDGSKSTCTLLPCRSASSG